MNSNAMIENDANLAELDQLTFGTELELIGIDIEKAARVLAEHFGSTPHYIGTYYRKWGVPMNDGTGREFVCMSDGSLRDTTGRGSVEVVTPILHLRDMEKLQKAVRALREAGAKANFSCGMHVHVGAAHLDAEQVANCARIFYREEALLVKAAGVLPERLGRWCQRTSETFRSEIFTRRFRTFDDLNRAWFGCFTPHPEHYNPARYRTLNLNNLWNEKKTIEFRVFNGTTHAGEIRANILLALALVRYAAKVRHVSRRAQFATNGLDEKYNFRGFMKRLGMLGDYFKNPRKRFLDNLAGASSECAARVLSRAS